MIDDIFWLTPTNFFYFNQEIESTLSFLPLQDLHPRPRVMMTVEVIHLNDGGPERISTLIN